MVRKSGFSLVELSIVLVILGLLVGGILSGQSLIRAAELRSVSTDISRYSAAINTFRDKYFSIPGDMANATSFWGKDNVNCAGQAGAVATPGTCGGDGDGFISNGERFRFWQHLASAGLVEGSFSGTSTGNISVPGTNIPKARYGGGVGGWDLMYYRPTDYGWSSGSTYINHFRFGAGGTGWTDIYDPQQFTAEDAWNLDTKIDDGKPGTGKLFNRIDAGCQTTTNPSTAAYALSVTGKICGVLYSY